MEERQDLISRQAAINTMYELMGHWFGTDSEDEKREIKREFDKLPSVTLKTGWIPYHPSELPKNMSLWATFDDGDGYRYVEKVFWDMTEWNRDVSNVIAYMPYEEPEPYREEGGE